MGKRGTRFVYDAGTIVRMTDRQYLRYICAGCHRPVTASQYGTVVGEASFNATRATLEDYRDARASIDTTDLAKKRRG